MTQERTRRLAAVWLADIVGYTTLAQHDEGTALRVVGHLQSIARRQSEARSGRVVKTVGDAVLSVFNSVDDAVAAAASTRDLFLSQAEVVAAGVSLRIGLHVGEVAESADGDLYGDAVNTAFRIEPLAGDGDVLVSDVAYRLLRQRSTIIATDLGEHELKGIAEPLRLFSVSLKSGSGRGLIRDLLQEELSPLQLLEEETGGGMGDIYLARDPRLRRTLAVKVLKQDLVGDRQSRARFAREAQVVAGLNHPNVVRIHSVGELRDGTPYFVMDYVAGGSYADRVERDGPLSVAEARAVLGEVASALEAAHHKGIVHRDIKAANVLYDPETDRAIVTDWGVAALDPVHDLNPDERLTTTGAVIGSPQYMSPEQLAGDEVGTPTDIFSYGLLAWELLTGESPFDAKTPRARFIAHLRDEPRDLGASIEDPDPELVELVGRCLSKEPWFRPLAGELAARLDPRGRAVLEWPPPGLAGLRESLLEVRGSMALGAGGWFLSGLGLAAFDRTGLAAILTFLALFLSTIFLLGGFVGITSTTRRLLRAAKGGHRTGVVLDVLADFRGDSGRLIVGTHEYATLSPVMRRRVRLCRRLGHLALWLVILMAIPSGLFYAAARAGGGVGPMPPWIALAPLTAAVVCIVLFRGFEGNLLHSERARIERSGAHPIEAARLVGPWYQAFDLLSKPSTLPSLSLAKTAWVASGTIILGTAAVILTMVPSLLGGTVGAFIPGMLLFPSLDEENRFAAGLSALEDLRVPATNDLTAREAGQIAWGLLSATEERNRSSALPKPREPLASLGAFERELHDSFTHPPALLRDTLMLVVASGFTAEQRSVISAYGSHPVMETLSRLSRARSMDLSAAVHPSGEADEGYLFPVPFFDGYHRLSVLSSYSAAMLLSDGRVDEAEVQLREALSVGFLLIDQPVAAMHPVRDIVSGMQFATEGLLQLYELTGRGQMAARLRAEMRRREDRFRPIVAERANLVRWLGEIVTNDDVPRGQRWVALYFLVPLANCASPARVLAGPAPEVAEAIAYARQELVVTESDAELMRHVMEWPVRVGQFFADQSSSPSADGPSRFVKFVKQVASLQDGLIGSQRASGCVALAGGFW